MYKYTYKIDIANTHVHEKGEGHWTQFGLNAISLQPAGHVPLESPPT